MVRGSDHQLERIPQRGDRAGETARAPRKGRDVVAQVGIAPFDGVGVPLALADTVLPGIHHRVVHLKTVRVLPGGREHPVNKGLTAVHRTFRDEIPADNHRRDAVDCR